MSEKPSAWTPEEKIALFAAVEQCRATGGQLDWGAIAATVPGRSAKAAQTLYYPVCGPHSRTHSRTRRTGLPAPSIFRRPCLRCRHPFDSLDRKRNWIGSACNEQIAAPGSIAV